MRNAELAVSGQSQRNQDLVENSRYMRQSVESDALKFSLDLRVSKWTNRGSGGCYDGAREVRGSNGAGLARVAGRHRRARSSGGGLELIPALNMTMAVSGGEAVQYTIEHAHTSIGYFSTLSSWVISIAIWWSTGFGAGWTSRGTCRGCRVARN